MSIDAHRTHPDDTAPPVPTPQERLESLNVVRGFLLGAAFSAPFWVIVAGALAAWNAVTR